MSRVYFKNIKKNKTKFEAQKGNEEKNDQKSGKESTTDNNVNPIINKPWIPQIAISMPITPIIKAQISQIDEEFLNKIRQEEHKKLEIKIEQTKVILILLRFEF